MATTHGMAVLVHLASGIGNIVLASPLLRALSQHGHTIDVLVDGDYADTADLLSGWSAIRRVFNGKLGQCPTGVYGTIIPAIPPFYWQRYASLYRGQANCAERPPDLLFYDDEQAYYLEFAKALGCGTLRPPHYFLPIAADRIHGITASTLVLAPGCKTGEMAAKRWPYFPQLAETFEDVVVVGTRDDLTCFDGTLMSFPSHVRSLVGQLSLRETAAVLAAAGGVVSNDSGLGHISGAVGTPTLLLFGPTPDRALGWFPPNVKVMRTGITCEPCWFSARLRACSGSVQCLQQLRVERVRAAAKTLLGLDSVTDNRCASITR